MLLEGNREEMRALDASLMRHADLAKMFTLLAEAGALVLKSRVAQGERDYSQID